MITAPGKKIRLNATTLQVVEHLIGDDFAAAGQGDRFLHVSAIEIADPILADSSLLFERLKRIERLC